MSKYFYDCEFLEGTQKKKLWWGNTVPTIDLISIGIVSEDSREYYAISKDFNLKEAWNRYDIKHEQVSGDMRNQFPNGITKKVYWIRENILKPIFEELSEKEQFERWAWGGDFSYKELKRLLKKYGKTNKQIAQEVKNFCYSDKETIDGGGQFVRGSFIPNKYPNIDLYGYYSAYDHVALCWLFGKMIDLPTGFPMYTIDLKQTMDEYVWKRKKEIDDNGGKSLPFDYALDFIKNHEKFPKQTNEHNSLSDAKFNFELYKFLNE